MSDYPMLISNKLHSFRNFNFANLLQISEQRLHISKKNINKKRTPP